MQGRLMVDYAGRTFGSLGVIRTRLVHDATGKARSICDCVCVCTREVERLTSSLLSGASKSCGCARGFDLTGQKFGRLFVLRRAPRRQGQAAFVCRCTCPAQAEVVVVSSSLRSGATTSCGCVRREKSAERNRDYGRRMAAKISARYRVDAAEDEIFGDGPRYDPSLEPPKTWNGSDAAARDLAAALGMA